MKKNLLLLLGLITLSSQAQLAMEGFEGIYDLPVDWSAYNFDGPEQIWEKTDPSSPMYPPYEGNYAAFIDREDNPSGATLDYLVTSQFTVPANPQLRFMSRLTIEGNQNTLYRIMLLPDGQDPAIPANYILVEEYTELEINPVQMEYTLVTVNLPAAYIGQNVKLAFVMLGDNGDRWLIDNVQVSNECSAPTNLAAFNIGLTSADLTWNGTGEETTWEIEILPENALPTGIGVVYTGTAPYTVTGLVSGLCYKFYVRSICSPDNTSEWAGPFTFCTAGCPPGDQCMYTFQLTDTWNDGWNSNSMTVTQDGNTVAQLTLPTGAEATFDVPVCDGIPIEIFWNGGAWTQEVGLTVYNNYGQIIYQMTPDVQNPNTEEPNTVIYSGAVNCSQVECWAPAGLNAVVDGLDVTLSWNGGPAQYEYYVIEQGEPYPTEQTEGILTEGTEVNITAPSASTSYQFFVRIVCGENEFSAWSEPFDFEVGTGNSISGTLSMDLNNDGLCGSNDVTIPSVEIIASLNGTELLSTYTNADGEFIIDNLPNGVGTVTLQAVAPPGYDPIAPVTQTIDFGTGGVDAEMLICMPFESIPNDLSIVIIPVGIAQPGFNANYQVVVFNNNPVEVSDATVTLQFNDVHVQFQSLTTAYTVNGNTVTFNVGAIPGYGSNSALMGFYVYPPMVNIGGEELVYTATVSMTATDEIPDNNTHVLNQIVVNSYDPNDITVHEGPFIYEEQADDYLTYTIRFQNTGTANAVNIKLENTLDPLLEWETFVPVTSSHNYYVTRNDDQLTFTYPDIQLPDSESNEPESHGFVTYRIKPKSTFGLGDVVSNSAEIYFDFNPAIITNTATTEVIEETMGTIGFTAAAVQLYPNPVKEKLNIVTEQNILSVTIVDMNGREISVNYSNEVIDTSQLSLGMYMVKITTDRGSSTHKILKQ